jgi:hypothetical protein
MYEKIKLWLDDERPAPRGWYHCKDPERAIEFIKTKAVEEIAFDHDLGHKLSGYDVAKVIEEGAFRCEIPPMKWSVHSANPQGVQAITAAMRKADEFWDAHTDHWRQMPCCEQVVS